MKPFPIKLRRPGEILVDIGKERENLAGFKSFPKTAMKPGARPTALIISALPPGRK